MDEIQIVGKKIQENIKEPIDEIQIIGKEKIQGIIEPIDEIEIFGKERIPNVYEPIDEIEIIGNDQDNENFDKNKENNIICMPAFEFQMPQPQPVSALCRVQRPPAAVPHICLPPRSF